MVHVATITSKHNLTTRRKGGPSDASTSTRSTEEIPGDTQVICKCEKDNRALCECTAKDKTMCICKKENRPPYERTAKDRTLCICKKDNHPPGASTSKNDNICACHHEDRHSDGRTAEKTIICKCGKEKRPVDASTAERMSVYCQYFATTSTSGNTEVTCLCSRDKGTPDVSVKGLSMCCQWSARKSADKDKHGVVCECETGWPGISIIGRPPSPPILISDPSNDELKDSTKCTPFNCPLPKDSSSSSSCPSRPCLSPVPKHASSIQSLPKSCRKVDNTPSTPKSVKIRIPDLKTKCEERVAEIFDHKRKLAGRCNIKQRDQHLEIRDSSPNKSLCETVKDMVNRVSSELFKDSSGACSLMGSATGSCDANAQASYYHNKLISTLQILQNREETIQVQAQSLAVAEERILALTERAADLKRELEKKSKESRLQMHTLRQTLECRSVDKVDVSVVATEVDGQSDIMSTLQSNLRIIEDLYRECFYETAKQEDLIDMLRKSYLDVRLMEKQKADQIRRLQNVINTQKLSLDRCQDIALEVDTLKMEISNFLSSSTSTNNDSGMWERSEESFAAAPEVHEELQEVTEQLLRLRELLNEPCICGLRDEVRRIKQKNGALEKQTTELWQRNCELEKMLQAKDKAKDCLEKNYKEEIKMKEEQLKSARKELASMVETCGDQTFTSEQLTKQLRQTEELLGNKSAELVRIQHECDTRQETINKLREELKRSDDLCAENCKLESEVSSLRAQVAQKRTELAMSGRRVRKLDAKLRQALLSYSEKENNTAELQSQLEEAHARGAALSGDVRRVLCIIRQWARRMRESRREQDNIIKEKDDIIATLQIRLRSQDGNSMQCICTSKTEELPCSTSSIQAKCSRRKPGQPKFIITSENDMASCSSAPTPPRRLLRKNLTCGAKGCKEPRWYCNDGQQLPERQNACQDPMESCCEAPESSAPSAFTMGNVSPTDELLKRMERLSESLGDAYRRWTKSDAR